MKLGVIFRETFRGSYHTLRDPLDEKAADLHLVIQLQDWSRLMREGVAKATGTLSLEGLADRASIDGNVRYRLRTEKRVPYDLGFVSDDGTPYRIRGQREPHPASPLEVFTSLRFSIYDRSDREVGRGFVRCDLRGDLRRTLASIRLRMNRAGQDMATTTLPGS